MEQTLAQGIVAAAVFAGIGILLFILAFVILDRLTPGSLWKEIIDEHNSALAILAAGCAIAISIIIAAAII